MAGGRVQEEGAPSQEPLVRPVGVWTGRVGYRPRAA